MIKIELKDANEAQVLANMINIALKATGIEAAEAALYFTKLIKEAAQNAENIPADNEQPKEG